MPRVPCKIWKRCSKKENKVNEWLVNEMGAILSNKEIDGKICRVESNNRFYQNQVRNVLKLVKPKDSDVILDVGCCSGKYEAIISHTCKIVGVDINPYAVKKAREYCEKTGNKKNWEVLLKDKPFSEMFETNQFNKIMLIDVTEHCRDKELVEMFSEVKKVCSSKAELVIYTPNKFHWTQPFSRFTTRGHINVKTASQVKKFVEAQGLFVKELYFENVKFPFFKKRICLTAKWRK